MKILCSWQRALVKYELNVAKVALEIAKARVFKGYGSSMCHFDIDFALSSVRSALKWIDDMKPPSSRKLDRMEKMTPVDNI